MESILLSTYLLSYNIYIVWIPIKIKEIIMFYPINYIFTVFNHIGDLDG